MSAQLVTAAAGAAPGRGVAAGLCVWDTLAPPGAALVAHDGREAARADVQPAEYLCLLPVGGARLLCGNKEGGVSVFDLRQGEVAHRFLAHEGAPVTHLFPLDGQGAVATLSGAAELKTWSVRTWECLDRKERLHTAKGGVAGVLGSFTPVLAAAAMVGERHLLTAGADGKVLLTRL